MRLNAVHLAITRQLFVARTVRERISVNMPFWQAIYNSQSLLALPDAWGLAPQPAGCSSLTLKSWPVFCLF